MNRPSIPDLFTKTPAAAFFRRSRRQLQKAILARLRNNHSVFFVQVGSNDGIQGDPLHELIISNESWKGIFIEPVGFLFDRLKQNYKESERFIFEKQAITPNRGTSKFFYVSERAKAEIGFFLPYWHDQLGSFSKEHILKHLGGILKPYILTEEIITLPLQDIFDKHRISQIDLLHIDTEGYDFKVLSTIDFSRYKPAVILYEHKHLSQVEKNAAKMLLKDNGYDCTQYGDDTLAIRQPMM